MKNKNIEDAVSGFLLLLVFTAIFFSIGFIHNSPTGDSTLKSKDSVIQEYVDSNSYMVTITTYNPTPLQGWGSGLITYDGSVIDTEKLKSKALKWCAVSHDLIHDLIHLMGKTILIPGHGAYEVRDLMHKRHKKRVDLLVHSTHGNFKKDSIMIKAI